MMAYFDYGACIDALSKHLRMIRQTEWSPTPRVRELKKFAEQLEKTADLMDDPQWMEVEDAVDADPPQETGLDGYPIPNDPADTRLGLYGATKWRLREIAEYARREAESYPNSRARPEIAYAAECFLHIQYQCEKKRPTLYGNGEAVTELSQIFESAGLPLSSERIRTVLGEALKNFDPHYEPPGLEDFLVLKQ